MKKALKIIGVLGVLFVSGLLVIGVLGFVGFRNLVPAIDKTEVPDTVGKFTLLKVYPPKGNIWGSEVRYYTEYQTKTELGDQALTYSINKFKSEENAIEDFKKNTCNRKDLEKKGELKDKSEKQIGDFVYCGGTLHFRNKDRSVTIYNFILGNMQTTATDKTIIEFVGSLPFNSDLDMSGFSEAYPSAKNKENISSASTASTDNPETSTSDSPPNGDVLSAFELAKKHKASKENVKQYNGKEITIRGYILIPPTITNPSTGGLASLGEKTESVEGTINTIECWFSADEESKFSALKGDQYITVKGIFSGEYLAEVRHCKLVKAE